MFIEELDLEITRDCTLNADHKVRGEAQSASMNLETIYNIFENVKTIGSLKLRGGEPLIAVSQLEKIIKLITKNGIKVENITLVTNGTIISERVCAVLKSLGMIANKEFNLIISCDARNYNELKSSGLLKRKIHNMAIFREYFGAIDMVSYNAMFEGKKEPSDVCLVQDTLGGAMTVDVYGNIVNSGLSFADEDEESRKTGLNINLIPFKEAVSMFANHELQKNTDDNICLGKSF